MDNEEVTQSSRHWYAVYTASRAEKKVRERFVQIGIECYLPLQKVIRLWSDRKKEVEIPILTGYIFVHVETADLERVERVQGVAFLLKEHGCAVPIPDNQINTLRFMVDCADGEVEFSTEKLLPGVAIMITSGQLKGLVGELVE
ncbi:MAG: UpxY family transcription antiterminator, partial [Bacteroidaceae bacterium]